MDKPLFYLYAGKSYHKKKKKKQGFSKDFYEAVILNVLKSARNTAEQMDADADAFKQKRCGKQGKDYWQNHKQRSFCRNNSGGRLRYHRRQRPCAVARKNRACDKSQGKYANKT